MLYQKITEESRSEANEYIRERWHSTVMIVRGKAFDLASAEGIAAMENNRIIGLITFILYDGICEIMSLNSDMEGRGIGTALVNQVCDYAKNHECGKLILITTNDNINAIRFYQKRGFDMVRIYHNALAASRKLKPEIPLIGENGIPLRHEIEFEKML